MKPPFAAFRLEGVAPSWAWLWLLLLAAGAGVLFLTYRGIFQRSERRLSWGLMLLRAAGLLLLVLALARPTWTRENERVEAGRVVVVVDTSRSMSLPDVGGGTRYAKARDAVGRLTKALADGRGGPPLAVDLFDIEGAPLKDGLPAEPTADRTDLTRALGEAAARTRSRPVAAFVLVSDGMDNTGRSQFGDWEGETPAPVHTLAFRAPETTDLDLAVRKPQVPEKVLVHNELRVEVPVAKTGGGAAEVTVSLKRGRETLAEQKVALPAGDAEKVVPLTFTPRQPGSFVFTAAVAGDAGERDLANNAVNFPVRVDGEPVRVLYLEGYLRYEYKYLKARMEDDPDLALVAEVRRASPERGEARASRDLLTEEGLKKFDVVILGDMEGGYLTRPEYDRLVKWLDGKGHSLLVLGGYASFGPNGFAATPLADVLPVVFRPAAPFQAEESFTLQLTEHGAAHPLFALSGDRVKDAAAWAAAPPLQGMPLVLRAKPGAETLAVNPKAQGEGGPAVVLAVQRAPGGGQVMVLAADTTWRWSRLPRALGQADTLYGRFWGQVIRWLAGRGNDDQRPLLTVSTDRADYGVGKKVTVRVSRQRRTDKDPAVAQELAAARAAVEVVNARGESAAVPLKPDPDDPDVETGEYTPSAGGRHEVAATLAAGGKTLANQSAEFLVQGADLELARPGVNRAALKALADATGGACLDVEQAEELASGPIARKERRTVRVVRSEYWNSPWLFAGFLGAVTGEWFLRRRHQLI